MRRSAAIRRAIRLASDPGSRPNPPTFTAQASSSDGDAPAEDTTVRDAHGTPLADGDAVIVMKDLKVKGASSVLKKGSKIKGIRLVDGADGHNVDCKTELGSMLLKSEFLKKA